MARLRPKSKTAVHTNVFSANIVPRVRMDISPDDTPSITTTNVVKTSASVTTFVPFAVRISTVRKCLALGSPDGDAVGLVDETPTSDCAAVVTTEKVGLADGTAVTATSEGEVVGVAVKDEVNLVDKPFVTLHTPHDRLQTACVSPSQKPSSELVYKAHMLSVN